MKLRSLIGLGTVLMALHANAAHARAAGHETVGGGSIWVDGQEYELADLLFKPVSAETFRPDGELVEALELTRQEVRDFLSASLVSASGEFFEQQIFNPYIEYRFVGSLPPECVPIPDSLFSPPSNAKIIPIGCTIGYLTYVIPKYFSQLGPLRRAMFIIHERLHAFAPNQSVELKMELVHALYVLMDKFMPATYHWAELQDRFALEDDDLALLNRLSRRIAQLSDRTRATDLQTFIGFTREGGLLINTNANPLDVPAWSISPGVKLRLGSRVQIDAPRNPDGSALHLPPSVLEGKELELRNTKILSTGAIRVSANRGLIESSVFQPHGAGSTITLEDGARVRGLGMFMFNGSVTFAGDLDGQEKGFFILSRTPVSTRIATQQELLQYWVPEAH